MYFLFNPFYLTSLLMTTNGASHMDNMTGRVRVRPNIHVGDCVRFVSELSYSTRPGGCCMSSPLLGCFTAQITFPVIWIKITFLYLHLQFKEQLGEDHGFSPGAQQLKSSKDK